MLYSILAYFGIFKQTVDKKDVSFGKQITYIGVEGMNMFRFYGKVIEVRSSHKEDHAYVTVRLAPYDRIEVIPLPWQVMSEQKINVGSVLSFDMKTIFIGNPVDHEHLDEYEVVWKR